MAIMFSGAEGVTPTYLVLDYHSTTFRSTPCLLSSVDSMGRKVVLVLSWLGLLAVPARAQQLTYTTHVEFRKVEAPAPSNPALIPVYANLASGLSRTAAPDIPGGTVDFDIALNSKELRVQASRPTGELSDGTM